MSEQSDSIGAAIVVRKLRRRFGHQQVLDGVDLDCSRGRITTIVGPSGCGKTVLLKHLNMLLRPDSGSIVIDGIEVSLLGSRGLKRVREKFGMLFQGGALFDSMSVFDNVAFPLVELTRLRRDEIAQRVSATLASVGLDGMESKYPSEMSGGMQK
ncbi:MAG: ABC transporter ATP-binding protein, partial [Candidatus Binataceae bacterium]